MKTQNKSVPSQGRSNDPKDYFCLRCEPRGIKKVAETFVYIDGLLNEERHPLCLKCKREWENEYIKLELDDL